MTHPPCLRLCPAFPGNPRNRIEGESPREGKDIRPEERRSVKLRRVSKHEARAPAASSFETRASKRARPPGLCFSFSLRVGAPSEETLEPVASKTWQSRWCD